MIFRRGQERQSSKCEASINQHDPSFEHRDRDTDVDNAVQGTNSACHRGAAMEYHGSKTSAKNKLAGPSTSVVFDNDNDNDTLREVPHPSNEGLALQARVSGPWLHKKESVLLVELARWQGVQVHTVKRQNVVQQYLK